MMRRATLLLLTMVALAATQLGGAASALAATTCVDFDSYVSDGAARDDVRVCAAPSIDFPRHSGWGRMLESDDGLRAICGGGLLPLDVDDPIPPCAPPPRDQPEVVEYGWRWTVAGWTRGPQITTRTRAWFAPYASGWRWAWTAETGWFAIPAKNAWFLWYA